MLAQARAALARQADAAKAVTFYEALQPGFVDYQKNVLANARVLADGINHHAGVADDGRVKTGGLKGLGWWLTVESVKRVYQFGGPSGPLSA